MDKREKIFDTLNNHFGERNVFLEFNQIDDEDIDKIIEMYEKEASKDGKDPWSYTHFNNLIIMQKCVYLVIKDNVKYNQITDKIEMLYLKELNRRLQRNVYVDGVLIGETYRAPYTEMGDYSILLADMCARHLNGTRNYINNLDALPIMDYENMISTYEDIKSDFHMVEKEMPEEQELAVSQAKEIVNQAKEEIAIKEEQERQQREIEILNFQQEIIKMENEKIEIEKRMKKISRETFDHLFSKQVSEKYPEIYQSYQESRDQVKNYSSKPVLLEDLKSRYDKASRDLQFYKQALPSYENYYQRFDEVKRNYQPRRSSSTPKVTQNTQVVTNEINQQQDLSSYINDGLKQNIEQYLKRRSRNIYLKNVEVTNMYQDGNYLIVEAKDNLGHSYHEKFNQREISKMFLNQSGNVKQEEIIQPNQVENVQQKQEEVIQPVLEQQNTQVQSIDRVINKIKKNYPDVIVIEPNGVFEHNGQYRVRVTDFTGLHTSVVIDKETYDYLNEYLKQHPESLSTHISNKSSTEQPYQETNEMTPDKEALINEILNIMVKTGEFDNQDMDISQKMNYMEEIKRTLSTKSMEELQLALSAYSPEQVEESVGMHR